MLKVKQIRKDINRNYLSSQSFTGSSVKTKGYESDEGANTFDDFAISYNFVNGVTYYLRFAAKRKVVESESYNPEDSIKFNLILYTADGSSTGGDHAQEKTQTVARDLILDPYVPNGYNKEWKSFTIVFTPNESYKFLSFKINRIGYDYLHYPDYRMPFIYNNAPSVGEATLDFAENGDFAIINNILPSNTVADKIGVQSDPGALFCINREPIYLGRSGIYEINNGTKISFVGVAAPNGDDNKNIQDFIFDYAYNE